MAQHKSKSYSEMIKLKTHGERIEYLRIKEIHHQSPRCVSNNFYKSKLWKETRKKILERDLGCDLGCVDVSIFDKMIVHHINPIDEFDIINLTDKLIDPENLITVSLETHNYIHYGGVKTEPYRERKPNDTKLW